MLHNSLSIIKFYFAKSEPNNSLLASGSTIHIYLSVGRVRTGQSISMCLQFDSVNQNKMYCASYRIEDGWAKNLPSINY